MLPRKHKSSSKSLLALVNEIKGIDIATIAEQLKDCLSKHPEYIQDWILYSCDKRTSEGWYFIENSKRDYEVGYYSSNKQGAPYTDIQTYFDPIDACSDYIIREVSDIKSIPFKYISSRMFKSKAMSKAITAFNPFKYNLLYFYIIAFLIVAACIAVFVIFFIPLLLSLSRDFF